MVSFCYGLIFPFSFCEKTKTISLLSAEKKPKQRKRKDADRKRIVIFMLLGFRNGPLPFHLFSKDANKKL